MNLNNRVLKIACLTVLMIGSGLRAMGVKRERELALELISAASYGDKRQVVELLGNGAAVNAQNHLGDTALIMAARDGNIDVCKSLLASGADTNIRNNEGMTALLMAATYGDYAMTKLFIDNGADIYAENKGYTPLMGAADFDQKKICELLIREMVLPKNQVDSVVTFIGTLQRRPESVPGALNLNGDIRRVLAQTQFNDIKQQNKPKAREQVMRVRDEGKRNELLNYLNNL